MTRGFFWQSIFFIQLFFGSGHKQLWRISGSDEKISSKVDSKEL